MIAKILKFLGKSVKKTTESVGKSMDFIDDVLEKEYITSTVDTIKESTGKVVEKAGESYQRTIDTIEENVNMDKVRSSLDKVKQKSKEITEDLSEQMIDKSQTIKNVIKEGEEIVRGFFDEEE